MVGFCAGVEPCAASVQIPFGYGLYLPRPVARHSLQSHLMSDLCRVCDRREAHEGDVSGSMPLFRRTIIFRVLAPQLAKWTGSRRYWQSSLIGVMESNDVSEDVSVG